MATNCSILALDVGDKRIGVATAHTSARMAYPLTTLDNPETFDEDIEALVAREAAECLVIGLPRGLDGQDTAQTAKVRVFGERLALRLPIPVYWTDEALTSEKAEKELLSRHKSYQKVEVDALAATYILEDFLINYPEKSHG